MIVAIVKFGLSRPASREQAKEAFIATSSKYLNLKGLTQKYYLISDDGLTAGGVYIWESKADAMKLYTADWEAFILEKYGSRPSVTYFESPVVVDNKTGKVMTEFE